MYDHALQPIDYRLRWKTARIPAQYQGLRLADFEPYDEDTAAACAAARNLVHTFPGRIGVSDDPDPDLIGRGLLLVGNPGTGKTRLACATATDLHLDQCVNIRFVQVAAYITALTGVPGLRRAAERGDEDAAAKLAAIEKQQQVIRHRPYVIWDDMGKEHHTASDYARDVLEELLRARYTDGLVSTITTNVRLANWAATYSPAMRSWIEEAFEILAFSGADRRRAG